MSYVAIARKWRPTTFDDIAGQQHVTRTLRNAIELGRIHHAFLFTGARGVGKTSAARVLSRALNCVEGPTVSPCGVCPSCKEILSGTSPDVIEIDGASNNSVEDVRELRESVRYLPQRGRSKVYIVDEVHMLSRGAFNALLKTLEEPPDHVVFIFATTEPQKIPETILSRVQRFDFKRIPAPTVVATLEKICAGEGIAIPEAGLRLIARAGEGSMRDSQSLLDRVISFGGTEVSAEQVSEVLGLVDRELLYSMLGGMLSGEADACLEAIERVYTYGFDLSEFTAEMLELLRNATLVGLSPASKRYLDVSDEERARLGELVENVPTDVFVRSFHVLLEVHEQVSRAPRPRLVLEMAVARLVSIRPARPVDQIVQRLGDIERRLRHGGVVQRPRARGGDRGSAASRASRDDDGDPARGTAPSPPPPQPRRLSPSMPAQAAPRPPVRPPPREPMAEPAQAEGHVSAEPESRPSLFERATLELAETSASPVPALPDEEEAGEAVDAPPPPPSSATPAERLEAFQVWLDASGNRYASLALDVGLAGVSGATVQVHAAHELHARNARGLASDARILAGLGVCFPGCSRLEVGLRQGSDPLTRREVLQAERRALLDELHQKMTENEVVRRVEAMFGARISQVLPPDETPAEARDPSSST